MDGHAVFLGWPILPSTAKGEGVMDSRLRRFIPEFANLETERAYRLWTLPETHLRARVVVWVGCFIVPMFLINDYLLLGIGATFYLLLAVRLMVSGYGIWFATTTGADITPSGLDRRLLIWFVGLLILNVLSSTSRPSGFLLHVLTHQASLFAGYLLLPMRYQHRVACGLGGALAYLGALLVFRPMAPGEFVPLLLAMIVVIVVGSLSSYQLERLRRLEYARLEEARATNERLSREIAERQRLAADLAESEQNLVRIFEVTPIPLSLLDAANGAVRRANQAFFELLGQGAGDDGEINATDACHDPGDVEKLFDTLRALGRVDGWELRGHDPEGGERWLAISAYAFALQNQPSVLACWYDISARKAEAQALRSAKQAAEAADRAKSRFLAMVSHEVRTPLNGVVGTLQLLDGDALSPAQRRHLDTAQQSADTLVDLLDTLLDYARFEGGQQTLEELDFDLHQAVGSVVMLVRSRAEAKGLALSVRVDAPVPAMLMGDLTRLRQVFLNLLSNAVKFTSKGQVSISAKLDASDQNGRTVLRVSVSDTGIGIPADMHQRVFEAFAQADQSIARRFGGAGLGLAICRQIVSLMGGEICVESEEGQGSRFDFFVPLRLGSLVSPLADEAGPQRLLNVLLVEDDPVNQEVAIGLLQQLGHRVRMVDGGEEAITVAANEVFDVVLMDLHLPGMDGLEATRRIRALPDAHRAAVPILALTADLTPDSRRRCQAAGISVIVAKPLQRGVLRRAFAGLAKGVPPASVFEEPVNHEDLVDRTFLIEQWTVLGPARLLAAGKLLRRVSAQLLAALAMAAAADDRQAVTELAHRLRSATGALGLSRMRDLAARLESTSAQASVGELTEWLRELAELRKISIKALIQLTRELAGFDPSEALSA